VPVRFGDFVFDEDTRELLRGGEVVPLPPKAFELLRHLLRRRPAAVSKQELHTLIWPDTNVTDASLATGSVYRLIWRRREIELSRGENLLGRDRRSIAWFDSPTVSRRHARILVTGEEAVLEDLGSRNGTWIGGKKITGPVRLSDLDEVKLGSVVMVFRVLEDAETQSGSGPASAS
jgi:hypothetical protein